MNKPYNIPKSLLDGFQKQSVIPFVGAGISQSIQSKDGNSLFASWSQLLESMASKLSTENDISTANLVLA